MADSIVRAALPAQFRLGHALVEPARNRLSGPRGDISLEPKVMAVLCCLAASPGQVLTRADLIDHVWGVDHGADESLTRAVSILRRALDDPKSIETISKRGYRLNMEVQPESHATRTVIVPSVSRRSGLIGGLIALLAVCAGLGLWIWHSHEARKDLARPGGGIVVVVEPFSAEPGSETYARRLGEDLAARISGYSLNKVTTLPAAPTVGTMGSVYRLKGDVNGNTLSVRLIDDATGTHVWTQTYARQTQADTLTTIVASEVQSPLLTAVKAQLVQRPLLSLRPWELNLLVTWVPGAEAKPPDPPGENSFWLQKRALELDPDYAPAHATFAEMLAYHALFDPPSDTAAARARARDHAERALQLAPYNAEVVYHVAKYHQFNGDRDRAEAVLQRVLTLQPSYLTAQADLYFVRGHCRDDNDAEIEALKALNTQLSPANPARWVVLSHLADLHLGRGDMTAAADYAAQSRDIVHTTWSSITLATVTAALGKAEQAKAAAHEPRGQWTRLDYGWFSGAPSARWCLGGPRTAFVQAQFQRLATLIPPPSS